MRFSSLSAARVLAGIAVALPIAGYAAASPLTLPEAQRIAVERSRQLAALDASILSAKEMAVAAGQLPDPVLRLGVDNLPVEGSDRFSLTRDFMTMRRIGVMQEFTSEEKRRLRSARYRREADRELAESNAALAEIQRETAIAWLETLYLEQLRTAVAERIEEARLDIEAAAGAYRAARGSQADVLTARASRVMLEDRLSQIDGRIRSARAVLARWVGVEAADAELAGTPPINDVPMRAHDLEAQLRHHPDIAAMSAEVAMAQNEVALAHANKDADWTWEIMYQQRGPAFSDMIGIGVSIPLQWDQKNRQDRELASKLALVEKEKAQRDEALRKRIAEVRTMLNEWENGRERLRRYEHDLFPLARKRTHAVVSAYRGGKGDLRAVLAARRNEIEVRAQALQIETEVAKLWAQLRYLYPDKTPGSHGYSAPKARLSDMRGNQ